MPISFLHPAKSLILLVGILLVSGYFIPQLAHADSFDIYGYPIDDFTTDRTVDVAQTYDPSTAAAAGDPDIAPPREAPVVVVGDETNTILKILHEFIATFFGWLVTVAGIAFDYSISTFTIGFGQLYETTNLGFTINNIWGTVRDIFNLTFIFGLIYIGFKMILDSSDSSARKMLVSLLGAALLVNFSLFITKFIIDFSNIAALKVYEAFETVSGSEVASIGTAFVNLLGLSSIMNVPFSPAGGFAYVFGLLIVLTILIYVFFAGAILLTIRFVVLNIYMVFSPIMFLGWVFPSMAGHSRKYWSGFLSQAFFAPAFLFMVYLSYRVTQSYNGGLQKDFRQIFGENAGAGIVGITQIIPFFAMVTIFLLASMMVAKNMGAVGAASTISFGQKLQKNIQGGITSYAGRNTVGRAADWAGKKNDQLEGSRTGRNFKRALSVASLGTITERERRNLTKAGKEAKFGGSYSRSDDKSFGDAVAATRTKSAREARTSETIRLATEAQNRINGGIPATQADRDALEALQLLAPSLSSTQLADMSSAQRISMAPHLTADQTETLMKNDKISDDDRTKIQEARQKAVSDLVGSTAGVVSDEFTKLSVNQIETMGSEWIASNAHLFSQGQMDDIKKSKKFTESQKNAFASKRSGKFAAAVDSGNRGVTDPTAAADATRQFGQIFKVTKNGREEPRKPSEIAMLPDNVLMSDYAIPYLSDKVLKEIATKGTLSPTQQQKLKTDIGLSPIKNPSADSYFKTVHAANNWGLI